jgi:membrane protein required for colicin V production
MHTIDLIMVVPLAWFAWKGLRKGLIEEVTSLLALVAGIWLAARFSWYVGGFIERAVEAEQQYISLAAFAITFVGVLMLMNLAGRLATKVLALIALGLANRLAGALFGFLKAAFIISVLLYFYGQLDPQKYLIPESSREKSLLYGPVEKLAPAVIPYAEAKRLPDLEKFLPNPEAP